MRVKVDIGDLKDFQKRLESKAKEMDAFAASCASELGERLKAKTVKRTPTITGHLKENWKALAPVKWGNSHVVWLYNNVDYAEYVEYGHEKVNRKGEEKGWQEGKHMLENSAAELERELDGIINKRLADFLKELM